MKLISLKVARVKEYVELERCFLSVCGKKNIVFLNSCVEQDTGRYSVLAFDPFGTFVGRGERVEIDCEGKKVEERGNVFDVLEKWLKKYRLSVRGNEDSIPFLSGAIGYLGYDLVHHVEKIPKAGKDDVVVPDVWLGFYKNMVVEDKVRKRTYIVYSDDVFKFEMEERLMKAANVKGMSKVKGQIACPEFVGEPNVAFKSNFTKQDYFKALRKVKEYLRKGDIYQVNLSQRLQMPYAGEGRRLYQKLNEINPAPFSAYLDCGNFEVISSSPERFIRVQRERIETCPIKGTCRRGKDEQEEEELKKELMASPKENAELTMIVDLERNDIGRVCEYGTVKVIKHRELKVYPTVWHTVSTIVGKLRKNISLVDVWRATFPGGSITGAPKIRAMEIIYELEPTKRGVYTGSIAYLGFDGYMDSSIVIRTIVLKNQKAYLQVGGGIVMDSGLEAEYEETLLKAEALLMALQ